MKRRILLWLCPILILFLGVVLYAVFLFNRLGGSIDVILKENYESVLAGQQMKESAERMDSGGFHLPRLRKNEEGAIFSTKMLPSSKRASRRNSITLRFQWKGRLPGKSRNPKAAIYRWRKPSGTHPIQRLGARCISLSFCRCSPR